LANDAPLHVQDSTTKVTNEPPPEEEEEIVDPKIKIDEECKIHHCQKELFEYEACAKRIQGKEGVTCHVWFCDLKTCIDHCSAPKIWKLLK